MTTNITIDLFNGRKQHVSTIMINDTIYNNDDIDVDEIIYNKDGSIEHKSKMNGVDEDFILDQYFSNTLNAVGEYSVIHINSLSNADMNMFNRLFSKTYEIPDCVEFTVSPEVQLLNLPKIHSTTTTDKEMCPICLEDLYINPVSYISGNKANVQYCNHKFHTTCIHEYCSRNEECFCPLCRKKIEVGDIRQLGGARQSKKRYKKRTKKRAKKSRKSRKIKTY